MELYEAMTRRRTVREFSSAPVPEETVRDIENSEELERFLERFTEKIVLAATAEGLFACTYTPYDAEGLMKVLGVPAGWQVAAVIPFGYPRTPTSPAEAEDLDSRLHVDAW